MAYPFFPMGTTLTIRNLDDAVKQKLRLRAAMHQCSMEAEAREILARGVAEQLPEDDGLTAQERMRKRIDAVRGIWKGRRSTDEIMQITRGE